MYSFRHTGQMIAIKLLEGFRITEKETHGLLILWRNLVDNSDLGEDFHHRLLQAQLNEALQVVCWVKSLHGEHLSPG